MVTVAIISEYNPFHSGHEYQIRKIREEFGSDTAIVAIMSGNFTQRGEIAFLDKGLRSKCAVLGGANLVLEIPFPFSASSAEIFAKSGVKIADSVGNIDYLSFGSECGDIEELKKVAEILSTEEYESAFKSLNNAKALGYPERCEAAYKSIIFDSNFSFSPNNILAIEYIKALNSLNSKIKPHTIKRFGADYNSDQIADTRHQSAMAIREGIRNNNEYIFEYLPDYMKDILVSAHSNGEFPTDFSKLSSAFISFLRLNPPNTVNIHDAGDGLYNRLYNASFEANDISSLLELSETKNYTRARIRRALLNIFFGVTSSDIKILPRFTQVLAMDKTGMFLLRNARKHCGFEILTKPSDYGCFDDIQLHQKTLSDKADSIFELTKPIPGSGKKSLTFTPFIKK